MLLQQHGRRGEVSKRKAVEKLHFPTPRLSPS